MRHIPKAVWFLTAAMIALLASASYSAFPSTVASVESCVMSNELSLSERLTRLAAAHQRAVHPTDDLGWPICDCHVCAKKLERMNAAYDAAVLAGNHDPDRFGFAPIPNDSKSETDYDGNLGRGFEDHMRDNGKLALRGGSGIAPWMQIGAALPKIEAPAIVPELPQDVTAPVSKVERDA